jgi:ketosteroid isomerase-like protein
MTSANLDLVRSTMRALERGDFAGMAEWVHPEIEFGIADRPEPRLEGLRCSQPQP